MILNPATPRTCRGTTKAGAPCRSTMALSADGLCSNHDPARVDEMIAVRAAGGRATGEAKRRRKEALAARIPLDVPSEPKTLDDAVKFFAWIAHAVSSGRLDARTGHEAAYALTGFRESVAKRDLERAMKAIRADLAELKKPAKSPLERVA